MSFPPARFDTKLLLRTADETAALARDIAPLLGAGDVILLTGPIGAGKSHFARSVIQSRLAAVGRMEDVPSPTFTLVQVYDVGVEIWHADLYRLTSSDEVLELALDDAFDTAICLVEWPDRLGALRPRGALVLTLMPDADGAARQARFQTDSARWAAVFDRLGAFGHRHD